VTTTFAFGASSRRAKAIRAARRTRPHVSAGRSGTHRARHSERRSELERFHRSEGEAREPKADVSAWGPRNPAHFTFSTCSRASPAGRGWTAAAGSANASGTRMEGQHSYLANASPGTAKRARGRGGLDGALPECVFLASTAFPRFFPAFDSRDPLSSPTPNRGRRAGVRAARDAEGTPAHEVRASPTRKRSRRAHAPPSVDATVRGMPNAFAFVSFTTTRPFPISALGRNTERVPAARIEARSASTTLARARI